MPAGWGRAGIRHAEGPRSSAARCAWCRARAPALGAQESEKRLRDIVTGKRQGGVLAVNGAAGRKLGKQRQQLFVFTVSAQRRRLRGCGAVPASAAARAVRWGADPPSCLSGGSFLTFLTGPDTSCGLDCKQLPVISRLKGEALQQALPAMQWAHEEACLAGTIR